MGLEHRSLRELVQDLANRHHHGAIYPMAARTGLCHATLDKWVKGVTKNPDFGSLLLLAEGYNLDAMEVVQIAMRRRRRARRLAFWLGALLLLGMATHGVARELHTPDVVNFTNIPSYRLLPHLRKRYQLVCKVFRTLLAVSWPTPEEILRLHRHGALA